MARLVNTAHEAGAFVSSTPALQTFRQPPAVADPDGSIPTSLDLSNVLVWAEIMRESAGREVRALRAQITGDTRLERLRHTETFLGEQY